MVKKVKKSSRKSGTVKVRVIGFKSISAKKTSPKKKR